MRKARSPEYPAIGLNDAIDKVRMVWERDYQNKLPKQVMAEHMGYKGLSGASLPILSALAKYGLIEGRGDETGVSDRALAILAHPPGHPDRARAVAAAAAEPKLFKELAEKYPGGKGSDAALRSYLLTQKFIPSAADAAIRAYRDTMKVVEAEAQGHTGEREAEEPVMQSRQGTSADTGGGATHTPRQPTLMRVAFDGHQIEVAATLTDVAAVDRLIRALQANKALLEAEQEPPPSPRHQQHDSGTRSASDDGISFMITHAQKAELRERGYSDDQIREMKPEEAHSILGRAN